MIYILLTLAYFVIGYATTLVALYFDPTDYPEEHMWFLMMCFWPLAWALILFLGTIWLILNGWEWANRRGMERKQK